MKVYYYTFTLDGSVIKEEIKARKNKSDYAIAAYTEYGGYEHLHISYLRMKDEGCIINASSASSNGCHMFSATIKDITEEMRLFSQVRAKKVKEIMEIEKELEERASEFKETTRRYNVDL